jgi:hypothetical protein
MAFFRRALEGFTSRYREGLLSDFGWVFVGMAGLWLFLLAVAALGSLLVFT